MKVQANNCIEVYFPNANELEGAIDAIKWLRARNWKLFSSVDGRMTGFRIWIPEQTVLDNGSKTSDS